jgi:hypothetical protein
MINKILVTLAAFCVFVTFFFACTKKDKISSAERVTRKPSVGFSLGFKAGHAALMCDGKYLCTKTYYCHPCIHVPCTGTGSLCDWSINVSAFPTAPQGKFNFTGKIAGQNQASYKWAAKSCTISNDTKYVNVPDQDLVMDDDGNYTFVGATITEAPIYEH